LIAEPLKKKCKEMATKSFRDLQEQVKDPAKLCQTLKFCKNGGLVADNADLERFIREMSLEAVEVLSDSPLDPRMMGAYTCKACKAVTAAIAYELQNPLFQKTILKILTTSCKSVLPGGLQDICDTVLVNLYQAGLNFLIDTFKNPDVCAKVKLC